MSICLKVRQRLIRYMYPCNRAHGKLVTPLENNYYLHSRFFTGILQRLTFSSDDPVVWQTKDELFNSRSPEIEVLHITRLLIVWHSVFVTLLPFSGTFIHLSCGG